MSEGAVHPAVAAGITSVGDRRGDHDRRRRPTRPFSRYMFIGRRRGARRVGEAGNIYVDRYTTEEWVLAGGVVVLSFLDLVFTLIHLQAGGREANPVMDYFLQTGGTDAFIIAKSLFTLLGVSVLLLHVRFDRVRFLLRMAFVLYAALFVFHLYVIYVRMA
ncbi:MAG: DUF5658 family protein [Planctomycetota bacterium]